MSEPQSLIDVPVPVPFSCLSGRQVAMDCVYGSRAILWKVVDLPHVPHVPTVPREIFEEADKFANYLASHPEITSISYEELKRLCQ